MGLGGEVRGLPHGLRASPLPLVLLGLGEVGAPSLSLSPLENPSPTRIGGGGGPPPQGGEGLPWPPGLARPPPPPGPFFIGGGGAPKKNKSFSRDVSLPGR